MAESSIASEKINRESDELKIIKAARQVHIPVKSHTHSGNMPHSLEKKYWLK